VPQPTATYFSLVDTAGPSGALRLLFWLRMVAIASQIAAVALANFALAGPLPVDLIDAWRSSPVPAGRRAMREFVRSLN